MLTVTQARELIFKDVPPMEVVVVPLMDALGCVLAEDGVSDIDMPPFDKSAMDGYAIIAEDTQQNPVILNIIEELPAGKYPTKTLQRGQAAKIMTGAPLPEGADCVVMVEKTESVGPSKVKVVTQAQKGQNICFQAEDLRKGEIVLKVGSLIRPQEIGVLASIGKAQVKIYRKPRCAMITTGDELVEIMERPGKSQIRNSNTYSVTAQVRAMGLECDILGIARDTRDEIRRKIAEGLKRDVLLLSGGVSVGEYDFVTESLEAEGVETVLHQVLIKPGRPFFFGKKDNRRVFALPGNPVSTFVIFEVFVRPFLGMMQMNQSVQRPVFKAKLMSPLHKPSDRVQLVPGRLSKGEDGFKVYPIPWHGSADIFSLTRGDCFLMIPPHASAMEKDQLVDVMLIDAMNG